MTFTYDDRIGMNNFSFDYKESMLGVIVDRIKDNEELMAEIRAFCEEELKEYTGGKLTLQDLIDLKIDDVAQKALDKVSIYIDADIEVEL